MINRRHFLGSLAAVTFAAGPAAAKPTAVFASAGYAIHGFDPVAYFRKSAPVKGSDAHRLMWRNAIWRFENAANLAAFESTPRAFAPRYGGYCAMSLTTGALSPTKPQAWAIHDGRLYLTHSLVARDRWLDDPDRFIALADAEWRAFYSS